MVALSLVLSSQSAMAWTTRDPEAHTRFVARANAGGIQTLFIGDSITDGWTRSSIWPIYQRYLGAEAFGISGSLAAETLWRIQNGELGHARTYVVLGGAPDIKGMGYDQESTAANLIAIVDYIRSQRPTARVVLVGALPLLGQRLDRLNAILATRADSFVAFLDTSATFADESLLPDGIHPSNLGYLMLSMDLLPLLWPTATREGR